jgi:hypothetical protein
LRSAKTTLSGGSEIEVIQERPDTGQTLIN